MPGCDLKVVLLCKGRGADASSYRPNRDESQWWSRRDALVRCCSSFLFGPSPVGASSSSKELVLFFDDDFSRIHMTVEKESCIVPTEQSIVSLWKQAAQQLNKPITKNGINCQIIVDPTIQESSNSSSSLPTGLDSKRHVLEYLQEQCSIDFLREHGLNSKPDIILRKTNKRALMQVWNEWRRKSQQGQHKEQPGSAPTAKIIDSIQSIYSKLLQPPQSSGASCVTITLHEKFDEFPCFSFGNCDDFSKNDRRLYVTLFLGAVRDMHPYEYEALNKACAAYKIPMVGVRFGCVPEFTSKILSVLAFHHAQEDVLNSSIHRLLHADKTTHQSAKAWKPSSVSPSCLHFVCTVPLSSDKLSVHLEQRNRDRIHWCLVRVIVCTLWRSRLVGSTSSCSSHTNTLTLLFEDGVVINLTEEGFVAALANQHQAAPCEFQILQALMEKVSAAANPEILWSKKSRAMEILQTITATSLLPVTCTVSIESKAPAHVARRFYDLEESESSAYTKMRTAIVILDIASVPQGQNKTRKIQEALLRASAKLNIPVLRQSVVADSCQDQEACTVIALQHFCYQSRLFGSSEPATQINRKRKK
jgi:hypothetical protein